MQRQALPTPSWNGTCREKYTRADFDLGRLRGKRVHILYQGHNHRLLHGRNDGTLIRAVLGLRAGQEIEAEERAKQFSKTVMPLVAKFWPIERHDES